METDAGTTEVVGFFVINPNSGEDAELEHIFVDPLAQGKGAGTALLAVAESILSEDCGATFGTLHVAAGNEKAEAFYQSQGWAPRGVDAAGLGRPSVVMSSGQLAWRA